MANRLKPHNLKWLVAAAAVVVVAVFTVVVLKHAGKKQLNETVEIGISSHGFNPSTVTVKPGTRIRWTNYDSSVHRVVPGAASSGLPSASPDIKPKGGRYEAVAKQAGTLTYHDSLTPINNGQIIVK